MTDTKIIFIHGLANKPSPPELERKWLDALAQQNDLDDGFDLELNEVDTAFVYWADIFYDQPIPAHEYESISQKLREEAEYSTMDDAQGDTEQEQEWLEQMNKKFPQDLIEEDSVDLETPLGDVPDDEKNYERIPLPGFVKNAILKSFVQEAYTYFFNKPMPKAPNGVRTETQKRILKEINASQNQKVILVGHSQGSFMAYDVMTACKECPDIQGFMTVGSPLGLDEVQDHLIYTRLYGYPHVLTGDWINVYDPYDAISRLDPVLANDFQHNGEQKVIDIKEENYGYWRHSATKYFKQPKLRQALRELTNRL